MQKDRKKLHKEMVRYMRTTNKRLAADEYLGLNRFRVDIFREDYHRYGDGSGGCVYVIFKISDKLTGNYACFDCGTYDYQHRLLMYLNDFLIRCSSGYYGHFPKLHYIEYDIHEIVSYKGELVHLEEDKDKVVDKYSWIGG